MYNNSHHCTRAMVLEVVVLVQQYWYHHGIFSEMHFLWPHPRPSEPETDSEAQQFLFQQALKGFLGIEKFENHYLEIDEARKKYIVKKPKLSICRYDCSCENKTANLQITVGELKKKINTISKPFTNISKKQKM